jgi:hypothetical protein
MSGIREISRGDSDPLSSHNCILQYYTSICNWIISNAVSYCCLHSTLHLVVQSGVGWYSGKYPRKLIQQPFSIGEASSFLTVALVQQQNYAGKISCQQEKMFYRCIREQNI